MSSESRLDHGTVETEHASASPLGGSTRRQDALDKVLGRACYVEDMPGQGVLHVRVLRSPHHHGLLLSLNTRRAASLPGVCCVLTADDIPGINGFPDYSVEEPVLAPVGTTLRMRGAPIALIVAENAEQAEAALQAVELEIQPLPHTFDMDEALKPGALNITGDNNELSRFELKRGESRQH